MSGRSNSSFFLARGEDFQEWDHHPLLMFMVIVPAGVSFSILMCYNDPDNPML